MKFTNLLDKNLLQINEVINKVIQNSPIFNQNNKSKEYFFSMKGPLDRECCPDNQNSIEIDCISLATFFSQRFSDWISTCQVIAYFITHWSTCIPDDVTVLTVVVVCSNPILIVMFRFINSWYLWNQIRNIKRRSLILFIYFYTKNSFYVLFRYFAFICTFH